MPSYTIHEHFSLALYISKTVGMESTKFATNWYYSSVQAIKVGGGEDSLYAASFTSSWKVKLVLSQRQQRPRQHASFSGRADLSAESLAILKLNVEGLTTAKLDVLKQVAINKATVVLLKETYKENDATLNLPVFTLVGHTKSNHHNLATLIKENVLVTR